jgi:putative DNA primase/helicase
MSPISREWQERLANFQEHNEKPTRTIEVINLANITPRNPSWFWYPYLPLGKLVIVAGAPGNGKSQLAALIAAMATRGSLYPGDVLKPSRVMMMCAEDDMEDTVVPRLLAVNADLNLIDTVNVKTTRRGMTYNGMITIPGDVDSVHEWAKKYTPMSRLLIMDPVASFFDRDHNALHNQDVRDALGPLVAMGQMYGITTVIILHLNKSESRDFAAKIAESHGFQALARSVLALGPDPDDPEGNRGSLKVLAVTKANLIKPGMHGLRCEVRSVTLNAFTPPVETSELALIGKCDISADDLLMPTAERTTRNEASEWLAEFVGDRWVKVGDVKKAAISDGWSWRTIERLRKQHGYQKLKQQGVEHGPWWMAAETTPTSSLYRGTGGVEDLGGLGDQDTQDRQPQDTQETQDRPYTGIGEVADLDGTGHDQLDLDAYRQWRDRMLGERDDDDS